MKKVISILLAVIMLLSLGVTGWAEESGITAEKVYQWLAAGDEASETAEDQAANGALRLAEMTVVLNSFFVNTEDDAAQLDGILNELAEVDVEDESYQRKLAVGLIGTFEGLLFFEQVVDKDGVYRDTMVQIVDSFYSDDDKMPSALGQAVNALYHCVYMASLILQELCADQQMLDQVQEEMTAFSEGEAAASNASEQLVNGSETLFRLLTAMASVLAPDGSFADDIRAASENAYTAAGTESDPSFLLANWLYGCVAMTGTLTEEVQA